jgi:hypothetical protein
MSTTWAANRLALRYRAEAQLMPLPAGLEQGIIDCHTHIHGAVATPIYAEAARLYGVQRTYTMTQLHMVDDVKQVLGDRVRFIAMPAFAADDKDHAHRGGYLDVIEAFATKHGARMMKLWASPRLRDIMPSQATDLQDLDSTWRRQHARLAVSLGMMIMVHVADPDTWFAAKYHDAGRYGTKRHAYVGLQRMLDLFPVPWIAAHMGGWPEDLEFLDRLLEKHPNLHLDTSAVKWVVRALSSHSPAEVSGFFTKWRGRLLFGTDLVTSDDQTRKDKSGLSAMGDLANSPEEAFELYCSRMWALRVLFETAYHGESPIADPDLRMIDPQRHDAMSAPLLKGISLPADVLFDLYRGTAQRLIEKWWSDHSGW